MTKRKICMLGAFAAGKTSLVQRFVKSIFSEKYLTTIGVKIDKKTVEVDGEALDLIVWDLQGEDAMRDTPMTYLRGASGVLLISDGTRRDTLSVAQTLQGRVQDVLGDVPFVLLVNKSDLVDEWEIEDEAVEELAQRGWRVLKTSAKTGEGVEKAFLVLASALLACKAG